MVDMENGIRKAMTVIEKATLTWNCLFKSVKNDFEGL